MRLIEQALLVLQEKPARFYCSVNWVWQAQIANHIYGKIDLSYIPYSVLQSYEK